MGYLCWDRNKALQRQSWKCSSKKAQERKEASGEKQEGIRKKEERKRKERKEEVQSLTHFLAVETHVLPGYHSGTDSAAYGEAVQVQGERFVF